MDGDGYGDIATTDDGTTDGIRIFLNDSIDPGTFTESDPIPDLGDSFAPRAIAGGDFDGDGDLDLAVVGTGDGGKLIIYENLGALQFDVPRDAGQQPMPTDLCAQGVDCAWPTSIVANDFDQDGDLDLAIGTETHGKAVVMYNNGTGTFAPVADSPVDEQCFFCGQPYSLARIFHEWV